MSQPDFGPPPGFQMNAAPVEPRVIGYYRYGCKEDGGRSVWVVACALCTHDDDGWLVRFDGKRFVQREFRTKKAAEACCIAHEKGDHDPEIEGEIL